MIIHVPLVVLLLGLGLVLLLAFVALTWFVMWLGGPRREVKIAATKPRYC
jgi:hypothetical protein